MDEAELLLKCFSNHNKRRLLNILIYFPMRHKDLVQVTQINPGYIGDCLKDFVIAGIIEKEKVKGEKMVIYLRWFYNTEIGIADVENMREIELSNLQDAYNKELNRRGKEKIKAKISLKSILRKRTTKNPLPEYPVNFLASVFDLFKFNDPQFKKDIEYIRRNRDKMRALSYLDTIDKEKIDTLF